LNDHSVGPTMIEYSRMAPKVLFEIPSDDGFQHGGTGSQTIDEKDTNQSLCIVSRYRGDTGEETGVLAVIEIAYAIVVFSWSS
jgi:hypothetical protein